LAGVLLDVTIRYGGQGSAVQVARTVQTTGKGRWSLPPILRGASIFFMFAVTTILWLFQFIIYSKFYLTSGVNEAAAMALGGAALFISIVETMGFYWATRFGLGLFAWLVMSTCLLWPLQILAQIFRVLALIFQGSPGKGKADSTLSRADS